MVDAGRAAFAQTVKTHEQTSRYPPGPSRIDAPGTYDIGFMPAGTDVTLSAGSLMGANLFGTVGTPARP
jgi:hypothetical protein